MILQCISKGKKCSSAIWIILDATLNAKDDVKLDDTPNTKLDAKVDLMSDANMDTKMDVTQRKIGCKKRLNTRHN